MVENLHFERLNEVMKEALRDPNKPKQPVFGGVQVVVTGDFCQLLPVKPFQHCIQCGFELSEKMTPDGLVHVCKRHGEYRNEDKWAFRSKAWQECNFVHVHLNTIHRQNDQTFIRIPQKCRIGRALSPDDTELLMNHECMVHHATKLFATREEVANVNRREFDRLKTMNHSYWCLDEFFWQRDKHPHLGWKGIRKPPATQTQGPLKALEDHRFDECVQLKKGMLVVLLVNLDLENGLCNGSQRIICGFEKNDPRKLPRARNGKSEPENPIYGERAAMKEEMIKKFIIDPGAKYKTWPVVRFHNGHVRTIYAECSIAELGDERPYSLLVHTQIPLTPAWAMTIHKS
ncbi:P-loop containing nucleoside triphosphate hydrolase protein [Rostrohypoxylon terebratum]|nr:P-loop containing nucleoside triphosphate hydrolase protein [Rostrohypoxylon terebratum]